MSVVHPEPGLRVADRYVLTSRIAIGGMGEVWRARDDVLGREVAVKLLRREYAEDQMFLTRFRAEARHAASLAHPGIASVYDYGELTGVAYLVMELVAGEPLSARLAREGALPAAVAVPLLQQTATALQVAHDRGLVHRDVKPANLLITPDQQVKVTDFGIARAGDQAPITRTGEVMGTAQYLSPEQALGRTATPASDVYSLGVVAYEALAGRRPFDGDSMVATAMAQVHDPPEPLPPNVPAPIAAVVLSALAKDAADRPASAAAFGEALGLALSQVQSQTAATTAALPPVPAVPASPAPTQLLPRTPAMTTTAPPPATSSGRRGVWWAVLAVLVAAGGVALVVNQLGPDDTSPSTGQTTTPATALTSAPSISTAVTPTTSGPTTTPTDSPTTTPTDQTITLSPDDYVGRDEKAVAADLRDLDLKVTSEKVPGDDGTKGTVVSLSPTSDLQPGDTVTLQVSDGKASPDGADAPGNDDSAADTTSSPTGTSTAP